MGIITGQLPRIDLNTRIRIDFWSFKFKLKFSGLSELKQVVDSLAKNAVDQINNEMNLQLKDDDFHYRLRQEASNIIWNEIYAVRPESPGYTRTEDLFNSPEIDSEGDDVSKINLVLRGGKIKGTKNDMSWAGKYTYGWFFEHKGTGFLKPSAMPYRPFMQILVNRLREMLKEHVKKTAKSSVKTAIKKAIK